MGIDSHLSTCVGTQSPKYLEMAQGHISLSGVLWMYIIKYFSASFSLLSFALKRCNLRFRDCVSLDGHHRGMEYFGSAVLLDVPV
jgi:hypothetical protein